MINTSPYPIANAEAPTTESLQKEFAISIDIYLEACEEDGHPPISPGEIVDYDALDEEFHRNPPQWYLDLKAEFADENEEVSAPTSASPNGAYQTEPDAHPSAREPSARDMV